MKADPVDPRRPPVDISEFNRKMSWDDRQALIRKRFPAGKNLSGAESPETQAAWKRAFDHDIDLAGRILREVLRVDQATPGRLGPRLALDASRAQPLVDEWLGRDPLARPYTTLPFAEALTKLAGTRSLRHLSTKVTISPSQVRRLLRAEVTPSGKEMETIAGAFGKDASYFLEYRVGAIAAHIMHSLVGQPEHSIRYYEAMWP